MNSIRRLSPLSIIFITIFIDLLGFGLVLPALPFYAESYGASPLTIGLLSMSYSLMQFLFAPFWGRVSDRVGRRPIILMSLVGSCAAFLVFGLAESLTLLFVARTIAGIFSSASLPTAQAYIADSTAPEDRAKGMGLIGAAFGLGFIFGPAMGGLLTRYGYGFPAIIAAGLAGANFIWAWFSLPETLHEHNRRITPSYLNPTRLRETFGDPRLAFLLVIFFMHVFAFSNMESTFALFSEHRVGLGAFGVGALLGEVGIIAAVVQGLMTGRLTRRFGEVNLALAGVLLMAIGLLLNGLVTTVAQMVAVVPLYALGSALSNPALSSLISRSASAAKQGATLGVAQGLGALGRTVGPPCGTYLFQRFTPSAPYWVGAAVLVIIFIAAIIRLPGMMRSLLRDTPTTHPADVVA
ncbi:MFS transporter [candidate division KSB1 bacterium]|nr:MFS transporter [candidate division KSB1 bacterium]